MQRKDFLKSGVGIFGISTILLDACKKDAAQTAMSAAEENATAAGCILTPKESVGPFPYPGGEITNPLQRIDITEGQQGTPLIYKFTVVNINNNCFPVQNARVDIWQCNKDGYYSGYGGQKGGTFGIKDYTGQTWLRGYQVSDINGMVNFNSIYPGWYAGRATHIHLEVFINNRLKRQTQLAFPENISNTVHVGPLYAAHGTNTKSNLADGVFGNSTTDLANETLAVSKNGDNYYGAYTIGIAL
ncbi:MAG TPA: hypothetical protein PLA68_13325 [Panacibacter sp.]|nr:hypothetical protein [Panacibacter sp.]